VSNLPSTVNEKDLIAHFGSIGIIATDRKTKGPKVKLYRDSNGQPKGDALISYLDAATAPAAIDWFHNKDFQGSTLSVVMAYGQSTPAAPSAQSAPAAPSYSSSNHGESSGYNRGYGDRHSSNAGYGSQPPPPPPPPPPQHSDYGHGGAMAAGGQPRKEGDWDCPTYVVSFHFFLFFECLEFEPLCFAAVART
jgi:RNA recognition motif-containing protein